MHLKERQPLPSGHIHGNMESQSENKINSSHKGEDESQQSPGQFVCLLLIVPEAENKIPTIITLDCWEYETFMGEWAIMKLWLSKQCAHL